MAEQRWIDGYWATKDGLRLHYRDYPGDAAATPVLCIPGLTRNARDFEAVAERLSPARRVIVAELRGRGLSDYSPNFEDYNARVYAEDIAALLGVLALPQVALFGTSLGGIVTMLLGFARDPRLAGVLLNDIGPVVIEEGLERIRSYVGAPQKWADWKQAARATERTHRHAYPTYTAADWERMARQLDREEADGSIVPDYDPAIAILTAMPTPVPPEPWRFIEGFRDMPGLLIWGELSDILSEETARETVARLPEMKLAIVPDTGHPPTLDEPAAREAVDDLLKRIDARTAAETRL